MIRVAEVVIHRHPAACIRMGLRLDRRHQRRLFTKQVPVQVQVVVVVVEVVVVEVAVSLKNEREVKNGQVSKCWPDSIR